MTCCFSGTVCHMKIKVEKNDCLGKQFLKAFHNIIMGIFLPICFAYIYYAHCLCVHQRDLLQSQDNNCLPLKTTNSQNSELKSNPFKVRKGFILALLSQMSLCECCSCGSPTTFKTINPTDNPRNSIYQLGRGT